MWPPRGRQVPNGAAIADSRWGFGVAPARRRPALGPPRPGGSGPRSAAEQQVRGALARGLARPRPPPPGSTRRHRGRIRPLPPAVADCPARVTDRLPSGRACPSQPRRTRGRSGSAGTGAPWHPPLPPGGRPPPRVLAVVCGSSPEDERAGRVRSHRGVLPSSPSRGRQDSPAACSRCLVPGCSAAADGRLGASGPRSVGTARCSALQRPTGGVGFGSRGTAVPDQHGGSGCVCAEHGSDTLLRAGHVSDCPGYVRLELCGRRRALPRVGRSLSVLALCFSSVSRVKTSWVGKFLEEKIALEVLRVG